MTAENFSYITLPNWHRPAIIAGEDRNACSEMTWRACRRDHTTYAKANVWAVSKSGVRYRTTLYLHRFIMGVTSKAWDVHHRDHDGLHCWPDNMRVVRKSRNLELRRAYGNAEFLGVTKCRNRFRACITIEGEKRSYSKHLGVFETAIQAAQAYDEAALQMHGSDAVLNFPLEIDENVPF